MQSWHYIIKFYKIGTHNLNTVLPTIWRWHFLGGPILRWKELAQMRVETIFMEFMEVMAKLERAITAHHIIPNIRLLIPIKCVTSSF